MELAAELSEEIERILRSIEPDHQTSMPGADAHPIIIVIGDNNVVGCPHSTIPHCRAASIGGDG